LEFCATVIKHPVSLAAFGHTRLKAALFLEPLDSPASGLSRYKTNPARDRQACRLGVLLNPGVQFL